MVARRAHNPEVVGSSPASATIKIPGIHYEYRDFSNFFRIFEVDRILFDTNFDTNAGSGLVFFGFLIANCCFLGIW